MDDRDDATRDDGRDDDRGEDDGHAWRGEPGGPGHPGHPDHLDHPERGPDPDADAGAGADAGDGDDDEPALDESGLPTRRPGPGRLRRRRLPEGPPSFRARVVRPEFERGGNREQRDALAEERFDLLGRIGLSLCLIGVIAAMVVRLVAFWQPRSWSAHDAGMTLLGTELVAMFFGLLAHRRPLGMASAVIGGVLALGAWIAMT